MNCPNCKKTKIAEILWGYVNMDSLEEQLEKGEIVLGGCNISGHDPRWECNDCHHQWGRREEL